MKIKITILFITILVGMSVFWGSSISNAATDCSKEPQYCTDGKFDLKKWCKTAPGASSSICCGISGIDCPSPCLSSYCFKEACITTQKGCLSYRYDSDIGTHSHGCDWVTKGSDGRWSYSHGIPTTDINNPALNLMWRMVGCPHRHGTSGITAAEQCFNFMQNYPKAHGSVACSSDADCKTTTTTKGSITCKKGETNPHYTCDNVNTYDYKSKSFTGIYCVKKDWCGVTNCDTKTNKSRTEAMYVQGVWYNDAIYRYNDRCIICPTGQKNPHNECKNKIISYKDGGSTKQYTYDTCEKVNTCGVDLCDISKNVAKGLGKYESCSYTGCYTSYDTTVYESAECKVTTTTTSTLPTTTTTSTTTSTIPVVPVNRYVCDPSSTKVNGYGQCILDNYSRYPRAKTCDSNHTIIEIGTPCVGIGCDVTPLKIYNTDCKEDIVTTTTTTSPSIACYISTLRFYDKKNDHEYKDIYSMFSKPDLGILDNPKLEYTAIDCDTCELTITPTIANFLTTNPNIFGNLSGEPISGHPGRYLFDKSVFNSESIILNVNELTPGSYTITLECTDPVTKVTESKSLKLNIFPQLRWREVVPVIN